MKTRLAVVLVAVIGMSGCTTYLYNEKRAEDYNKNASHIGVVWLTANQLQLRITKIAQGVQPVIGPNDREETSRKVHEVIGILQGNVSKHLVTRLNAEGVTVRKNNDPDPAQASLVFIPRGGIGDCSPLGCMGSVDLQVSFIDAELKKPVWTGYFKVGTSNVISKPDEGIAESFYGTLVGKLKNERLISPRKQPASP